MLVIFDCDGVLIDSEIIACAHDAEALTRLGRPTTTLEFARRFTGVPFIDSWRTLEAELGTPLPENFLSDHRAALSARFLEELRAIEGVREALEAMDVARCVASSTGLASLRTNLQTTGLIDLFDPHIFSASQVKRGKPAPDVFLHACSQMGVDPADCLVVEDSVAGVTAARRAGMKVVGFIGGGHADDDLGDRLTGAGARTTFKAMSDLHAVVAAHLAA